MITAAAEQFQQAYARYLKHGARQFADLEAVDLGRQKSRGPVGGACECDCNCICECICECDCICSCCCCCCVNQVSGPLEVIGS